VTREVVYTIASFYAEEFADLPTSSGEIFNPDELTTAHPRFPFGTILLIENLRNGRATVVRVNDRGPYIDGRGIDLSRAAAELIGMIRDGLAPVRITVFYLPRGIER
jgi:rare lipoprotein A